MARIYACYADTPALASEGISSIINHHNAPADNLRNTPLVLFNLLDSQDPMMAMEHVALENFVEYNEKLAQYDRGKSLRIAVCLDLNKTLPETLDTFLKSAMRRSSLWTFYVNLMDQKELAETLAKDFRGVHVAKLVKINTDNPDITTFEIETEESKASYASLLPPPNTPQPVVKVFIGDIETRTYHMCKELINVLDDDHQDQPKHRLMRPLVVITGRHHWEKVSEVINDRKDLIEIIPHSEFFGKYDRWEPWKFQNRVIFLFEPEPDTVTYKLLPRLFNVTAAEIFVEQESDPRAGKPWASHDPRLVVVKPKPSALLETTEKPEGWDLHIEGNQMPMRSLSGGPSGYERQPGSMFHPNNLPAQEPRPNHPYDGLALPKRADIKPNWNLPRQMQGFNTMQNQMGFPGQQAFNGQQISPRTVTLVTGPNAQNRLDYMVRLLLDVERRIKLKAAQPPIVVIKTSYEIMEIKKSIPDIEAWATLLEPTAFLRQWQGTTVHFGREQPEVYIFGVHDDLYTIALLNVPSIQTHWKVWIERVDNPIAGGPLYNQPVVEIIEIGDVELVEFSAAETSTEETHEIHAKRSKYIRARYTETTLKHLVSYEEWLLDNPHYVKEAHLLNPGPNDTPTDVVAFLTVTAAHREMRVPVTSPGRVIGDLHEKYDFYDLWNSDLSYKLVLPKEIVESLPNSCVLAEVNEIELLHFDGITQTPRAKVKLTLDNRPVHLLYYAVCVD